jgi:hypothetical protein
MNRSGFDVQILPMYSYGVWPSSEIVDREEVGEVGSQLIMVFAVKATHRRVLDRAVHPFDLAVRPRVVGLSQTVLDTVHLAGHVDANRYGVDGVTVPKQLCDRMPLSVRMVRT